MSIDVDWDAATSGPDGDALAERIRSFVHDKFQQVALPRFIRSVEVTSFDFGTVRPELEIRDVCDPFADFYEEDEDDAFSDGSSLNDSSSHGEDQTGTDTWRRNSQSVADSRLPEGIQTRRLSVRSSEEPGELPPLRSPMNFGEPLNPYFFPRSGTPGIPGGTSNLGYYYMPLGGLSGTQTPLSPVARGTFSDALGHLESASQRTPRRRSQRHSEIEVDSAQSRPSTANTIDTRHSASDLDAHNQSRATQTNGQAAVPEHLDDSASNTPHPGDTPPRRMRERKTEDLQIFCRIRYAGNIKLSLTAQILLDYPMPSFAGLPLKLNITGVSFDGVAVLAYIRNRVHFCFLSPEDAAALLGEQDSESGAQDSQGRPFSSGDYSSRKRDDDSLLRDLRIESEIGRKENGKQVLKNVGKVEKFVLEQVRHIFEDEFVYPSFWTFLV